MKSFEDYIVPWVRSAEPYSDRHMDIAWENPQVLRMMSNENLIAPPQRVLDAIQEAARLGNLYPGSGPLLRQKLGEANGLSADHVVLGNGSTDVINFVIHTFVGPGDEVIIPVPTFPMYEARTRVTGGVPVQVPMTPDFGWDIDGMLRAVTPRTRLIFVCSPNNPTGNQIPEADLLRLLESGIPLFYDEAYFELEDQVCSRVGLIEKYPHMLVNRTFSKAYGLAGFRVGYALCNPAMASYFNRVRIPWNVSLPAMAAALAELEDREDQEVKRRNTLEGRQYITEQINSLPGLHAYPSEGNFVLIDASALGKSSAEMKDAMTERGIFIRPMSGHNMPRGFIRITVGTPEQNQLFIQTFKAYIQSISGQETQ